MTITTSYFTIEITTRFAYLKLGQRDWFIGKL